MAKVQYGGGVTAITGSIGGWSFQTNRSGAIIRIRGGTLKNSTSKQTSSHQNLAGFHQDWQAITAEEKVGWDAFAVANERTDRYGTKKTLTGLNWFSSINYYRVLVGESILTTAPVYTLPTAVQDYNYAVRTADIILNFTPVFNPADNALLIFTTPYTSRITTSLRQLMRLTKIIDTGPFGFYNITSDWESTHGMSWPPSDAPICGWVGIMVQTIKKSSGISSAALIKSNGLTSDQEGIGYMSIGNDFIIRAGVPLDPDAQAFIDAIYTAGGSLSNLEENAINIYVIDAKNNVNAWWNSTLADYPMVGGTMESCKINLKNPGTFDIDFVNTVNGDFVSTGWTPNGSTSYARTGLIPSAQMIINHSHMEYYSRTNILEGGFDMGVLSGGYFILIIRRTNLAYLECYSNFGNGLIDEANNNSAISLIGSRISNVDLKLIKDGIQLGSTVTGTAGTLPTKEIYIGCYNNNGVPAFFNTKESAGNQIGHGLTILQALAQYNARQLMNTTLSRQV